MIAMMIFRIWWLIPVMAVVFVSVLTYYIYGIKERRRFAIELDRRLEAEKDPHHSPAVNAMLKSYMRMAAKHGTRSEEARGYLFIAESEANELKNPELMEEFRRQAKVVEDTCRILKGETV